VCVRVNGFKPWTRKVHSYAENALCKFCSVAAKSEHIEQINRHYASNKHQRNAVSHYTMRQHGGLLNFDFQKSSHSSNQLFHFAFVNTGCFVNGGC